ncbi:MAG TPA: N-acetylmuramoyl-L-alanine amidase [Nitrospinota bacterium]|nr:N-acetylmuramoyl-L-alanine amidase [Nitrospinota bacterium]
MYRAKFISVLFTTIFSTYAFATNQNVESMYQEARHHFYTLFSSPKKMEKRSEWLLVISRFNFIANNSPNTDRGRDAVYTMGLLYKKLYGRLKIKSDRANAIKNFQRVIIKYPNSAIVDEAERQIGDMKFSENDYASAAESYLKVHRRRLKTKQLASTNIIQKKAHKRKESLTTKETGFSFTKLQKIRRYSRSGYTRIILHLSKRTAFRSQKLTNPERVFIDILGSKLSTAIPNKTSYSSGLVRSIRMGKNDKSVIRVVFDLAENSYHKVTVLPNPFRIVVDFGLNDSKRTRTVKNSITPNSVDTKVKKNKESQRSRNITIVIDPGHGGKDAGAVGSHGIKEKEVALSIAKKLRVALKNKIRCKVILTRATDRFISLDERTVIANSSDADLFVSLHANSSHNRLAKGLETYFLSPARSKDEMETAARENLLVNKTRNLAENDIAYIMTDLENTQKINDSVKLAQSTQSSMVKGVRGIYRNVEDRGVKQAMFYVLLNTSMPSILVEANFVSNRRGEKLLVNHSYQSALASSIATGIVNYIKTYQTVLMR